MISQLKRGGWLIAALAVSAVLFVLVQIWLTPPLPQAGVSVKDLTGDCPLGLRGTAGRHTDLQTISGLRFSVVAPRNYQGTQRYGLLMMFPPAGFSNASAERFYQLTAQANAHGYVVVYSAAIPLSRRALLMQHEVVPQVMATWCIDPSRMVFAGHSDGGSVTTGLTVREKDQALQPSSIVISAAGITAEDLQQEHCPAPLSVTLLHNPDDELFPGYGQGTAKWWGQCMQCSNAVSVEATGCHIRQCSAGKILRHCVTTESHSNWPSVSAHMFEWLN